MEHVSYTTPTDYHDDKEDETTTMGESSSGEESTLFQQVVDGLIFDQSSSSCILNMEGGGSQSGGTNSVNIIKLTLLIMLAHGLINLTREQVILQAPHPVINVSALKYVKNLAIFGPAPTGIANVGTCHELSIMRDAIQDELLRTIQSTVNSSLQSIEDKIKINRERLQVIREPRARVKRGIVTRICNTCFRFWASLTSLSTISTVENYSFKNVLSVCRNIFPSYKSMAGGVKQKHVKPGGVKPGGVKSTIKSKSHSMGQTFSMSNDMCVLLLDDLRSSIQNLDRLRFPDICAPLLGKAVGAAAMAHYNDRFRKLYIINGFGSDTPPLPFVNKQFHYDTVKDATLNMGVIKLKFSIDSFGNVTSSPTLYDPRQLMLQTGKRNPRNLTSFSCSMQEWIELCVEPDDETICIVDLSCSGINCQNPMLVDLYRTESLGGGKIIKKKSYSRKKARRNHQRKSIRKKSIRIKRVRNKRSIRKNKTKN